MQKLFTILLSLFVSITYVSATHLSQSHHHHHGTICLKATAMQCCENGETPGEEQDGNNINNNHREESGCTYKPAMLAAAFQRETIQTETIYEPAGAALPTHIAIIHAQTDERHIVVRDAQRYVSPSINQTTPLRAPPEAF